MRRSTHALIAALAAGLLAAPAYACPDKDKHDEPEPPPPPPPVCNLVVDPAGDATLGSAEGDIVSADIATGETIVVAAVRVKDLDAGEPATATGDRWDFTFTVTKVRYAFSARRTATGTVSATLTRDPGTGPVPLAAPTVTLDTVRNQVTWVARRSDVVELPAVFGKTVLYELGASTFTSPADVALDTARSFAKYADGRPSCLSPK